MSDLNFVIWVWRFFICILRDFIFVVFLVSLELSFFKFWWIFLLKEMFFVRLGFKLLFKFSVIEFSRLIIGRKCGELIRLCGGIFFWWKRLVIKLNVEVMMDDGIWYFIKFNNNKCLFGGYKFLGCYILYFVGKFFKYLVF